MTPTATAHYRVLEFRSASPLVLEGSAGVLYVTDHEALNYDGVLLPQKLRQQSSESGDSVFLAERVQGAWVSYNFARFSKEVDALAQGLLDRGFLKGDRIVFIARNSIAHALMMYSALSIGVVVAPLSPLSLARPGGAREILDLLQRVAPRACVLDQDVSLALSDKLSLPILECALEAIGEISRAPGDSLERARQNLSGDDWAKLLFTSGSTGKPKGVIHTHEMLAAAQAASAQVFITHERAESVDWLPWHHTFGGNVNLNAALWNGDALRIDTGLPVPGMFETTLRNLADVSPTFYTSVPATFFMLVDRLEADSAFAAKFFSRLRGLSAGGAALPLPLLERLQRAAERTCGARIPFGAGYGMTETTGVITMTYWLSEYPEAVGLPLPGVELKLVALDEERFEARVRGPNVTPGYLDDAEATDSAFDEEGFFRTGDALAWLDPDRPELGLRFAGRLAEDFKLFSGTFVRATRMRTELTDALAPLVKDVLIVGEGRDEVGALLVLSDSALQMSADDRDVRLRELVGAFNRARRAASRRIGRYAIFASPPNAELGEVADKGSLNVVVCRRVRRCEIEALYSS